MSIQKTDQGTYRARIRDRRGKQLSKTFKLKADARIWEAEQLRARDADQVVVASSQTVASWSEVWLTASRHLAPSTLELYRKELRLNILPHIGDMKMAEVTSADIDDMLTHGLERGLSPHSVHKFYRTTRSMFNAAVSRGKLQTNPVDAVNPPRLNKHEMRFLDAAGVELLADTIGDRYRAWVLIAAWGGLRWSEAIGLRPQDFVGDVIDVNSQLLNVDGQWVRSPVKTKASKRKVPMPPSVSEEIRYHIASYPGDLILTNRKGEPISHSTFTGNVFKPALVRAGLDRRIRIHDMRHTAVALAIQAGAHPKTIQMRLGHASIAVTLDDYGHLMPTLDSTLALDLDALRRAGNDDY